MAWMDDWLPRWQFDEVHHIRSQATPGGLLDAAAAYNPAHDGFINAALRLREAPARLAARLGAGSALAQRPRFGLADFVRLGRQGDQALAYGLVGRFWEPGYGLQPLADADAFMAYADADAAKLVLGFVAQPAGDGSTTLTTLTRVACGSEAARRKLAAYWLLIRPISGLIRRRILADIRRVAEAGTVT